MAIVAKKTATSSEIQAIEPLDPSAHLSMKVLAEKLNEVIEALNQVANRPTRDRGPKSKRDMIREDAWRVRFGDLADVSTKEAAKKLGLSYGQVYSARGEYTFKDVTADEFEEVAEGVEPKDDSLFGEDASDESIEELAELLEDESTQS